MCRVAARWEHLSIQQDGPDEVLSRRWHGSDQEKLIGKRDRALLALLIGCGLRRQELAQLKFVI
jgi:site-specific recombinase XerD